MVEGRTQLTGKIGRSGVHLAVAATCVVSTDISLKTVLRSTQVVRVDIQIDGTGGRGRDPHPTIIREDGTTAGVGVLVIAKTIEMIAGGDIPEAGQTPGEGMRDGAPTRDRTTVTGNDVDECIRQHY